MGPEEVVKCNQLDFFVLSAGGGFRFGRKSMIAALRESLKRLGKEKVDLYQVGRPLRTNIKGPSKQLPCIGSVTSVACAIA